MTISIVIITILYLLLIGSLIVGFKKVKDFTLEDIPAKTKFSVLIAFRNEVEKLPLLLKSLSELNYPKEHFEVIFIDDASDDDSVKLIQKFLDSHLGGIQSNSIIITNNRKTNSPKKDAITKAIEAAKYNWIITTDADCIVPKYWLDSFDCFIQKNETKLIVAPVTYTTSHKLLNRFQLLDFLSLQGSTIGGFGIHKPFLCNGANLAYEKAFFKDLNGFDGNTEIASGDDIFMLEKAIKQAPQKVHYLKNLNAIVYTEPQHTLKSLIAQRLRWAAKTSRYKNGFGKLAGLIVLLMNVTLICSVLFAFLNLISAQFLAYVFVIKFSIDFLLIFKTARFFNQEQYLASYFLVSLLYPFFSVYIAFTSVFKGYKWKGRAYSK
jgi:biofilm PGA synthesis N-glycosyltransferase PgaC